MYLSHCTNSIGSVECGGKHRATPLWLLSSWDSSQEKRRRAMLAAALQETSKSLLIQLRFGKIVATVRLIHHMQLREHSCSKSLIRFEGVISKILLLLLLSLLTRVTGYAAPPLVTNF